MAVLESEPRLAIRKRLEKYPHAVNVGPARP